MGLCHTAAILSRETKVAFSYLSSQAPKFFTARSRVVKQSFFSLSGQYGRRANKVYRPFALWRQFTTTTRILFHFPFMFKFKKSPNLHKKVKNCRILFVLVEWRHHVNGLCNCLIFTRCLDLSSYLFVFQMNKT